MADSLHLQYLIFYICARSRQYCDVFVNDLWTIASSGIESLQIREGSFSYLISLILNAQFVRTSTVFSFLKILIQSLNSFLDGKGGNAISEPSTDNDVMYYNFCIGFCQLFCAFHNDLERIQIECLKNMDLKRVLLNPQYNPMQFFPSELRECFLSLAGHYRIGYCNNHEIRPMSLTQFSATHRDHPAKFGMVKLPSVKSRIAPYVNSIEAISDVLNTSDGMRSPSRGHRTMSNSWLMNSPTSGRFMGSTSKIISLATNGL